MSLTRFHLLSIGGWLCALIALLVARSWLEAPISGVETAGWLVLAAAPIVLLLTVFRGSASSTIAQVLYDAEQAPPSAGRRLGAGGPDEIR